MKKPGLMSLGGFLIAGLLLIAGCGGGGGGDAAAPAAPGTFNLVSPVNNDANVALTPNFQWAEATGATTYTLQIAAAADFSALTFETTTTPVGTTSFSVPSGVLAAGTLYYWRVTAVNSVGGTIAANAPFSFTTTTGAGPTAPGVFSLVTPTSSTTGVLFTPSFAWQSSDGATTYTFQLAGSSAFSSLSYENAAIPAGTTGLNLPSGVLSAGTQYFWRVTAVNSAGSTTAVNAPFDFTTIASGVSVWSVTSNPSGALDEANGMVKDANAAYIVGYDQSSGRSQWRIEKRYLSDGSLVSAFGTNGVVSGATTSRSIAYAAAKDAASLYVVGYDTISGVKKWRIEKRSLATGALDAAFGTSGVVSSGTATTDAVAYGLALDANYLYIVGYDIDSSGNREWRIEKRALADGALVTAFDSDGIIQEDPSPGDDTAYGIAVDATAVYVVGSDEEAGTGTEGWRIEKLNVTTGATLTVISEALTAVDDRANAVAIDSTYMYVVGYDSQTTSGDDEWRIEKRSLSDLSLVTSFGAGGIIQENPSAIDAYSYDDANAVAVDSSYLYVSGFDNNATVFGGEEWRLEKRSLSSGALVPAFGTSGVVTANGHPSPSYNEAWALVVDEYYLYTAGFEALSATDDQWRIEKRAK
jgi:hypothetical protein